MAEHERVAALFPRDTVEIAAPQPRTERTIGAARRHLFFHHGIGVAIFDAMGNADLCEIFRQHMFGEIRLALIQIAGDEFDRQKAAPFQIEQQRQKTVAVLAAGKADKPALLAVQHAEITEGLTHIAKQPLTQLVEGNRTRCGVEQRMRTAIFSGQVLIGLDLVCDAGENVHD
ncbi:hypothetical protein D3C80_922100 [compost metagenome]